MSLIKIMINVIYVIGFADIRFRNFVDGLISQNYCKVTITPIGNITVIEI